MKHRIKMFFNLISYYGFWGGLLNQLKLTLGFTNNIKLKGIKFPFKLRKHTSDKATFEQVFLNKEYDLGFIKDPKIIIDGGSNIGLFAIKMKNDFENALLICVEPDSENFDTLKKNTAHYSNINLENAGLWNKDTNLKVYDKYNAGKWGMVVEEDVANGKTHAISIDSLMNKYQLTHIDILKIDIETSEKQLFSENYTEWLPKVKTIIIELHDRMDAGCAKTFFKAINNCYTNYNYSTIGENVIITNLDLA